VEAVRIRDAWTSIKQRVAILRQALREKRPERLAQGLGWGSEIKSAPRAGVRGIAALSMCGAVANHRRFMARKRKLMTLRRALVDPEFEDLPQDQHEPKQTPRSRQIQRRMDVRMQAADTQKR
jgi:hypothetical protein